MSSNIKQDPQTSKSTCSILSRKSLVFWDPGEGNDIDWIPSQCTSKPPISCLVHVFMILKQTRNISAWPKCHHCNSHTPCFVCRSLRPFWIRSLPQATAAPRLLQFSFSSCGTKLHSQTRQQLKHRIRSGKQRFAFTRIQRRLVFFNKATGYQGTLPKWRSCLVKNHETVGWLPIFVKIHIILCIYLAKSWYFTNLDFPEIMGFLFLSYLLGWGRVRSQKIDQIL